MNKRGNSNQRERIALLKRFVRRFGRAQILGILGDREFIGDVWWQWLTEQQITYLIRIKENQLMKNLKGRDVPIRTGFSDLKIGQCRGLRKRRRVGQQWVWLTGLKLDSGELLILAGNQPFRDPLGTYRLRWEIESLFQCLKGRGFHWEDTRLTRYFRIKKMMALMAIAFCWAHKTGEWKQAQVKPLKVKKHGRLEQSLFRYGLDVLTDTLLHQGQDAHEALRLIVLLMCPPDSFEMCGASQSKITIYGEP